MLKGEKCTTKCTLDKRQTQPGQPKKRIRSKPSEYHKRLREKQRAKIYAGLMERQFRRYFANAEKTKGLTGMNLLMQIETRLDTVVRLAGFATSLRTARQMVKHGHVMVNGKTVSIPSCHVETGDTIVLKDYMKQNAGIIKSLELASGKAPAWLEVKAAEYSAKVLKMPSRQEITTPVNEQLIVELYSK
jgi:small subunit ribosomal protein S4